jgi:hypothetical protein
MSKEDKIGLVEWLPVHKHSRVVYLKLRSEDATLYDIQPGDKILVELRQIKRGPRTQESESNE